MNKILVFIVIVVCFISGYSYAQNNSQLKVSGYIETYYGYDFNRPADNNRPQFVYSHNRHNEVNVNLGFIKGSFDNGSVRANLAIMTGTYSNANLAAEPGVLKNIFEANAGIKLSKTADLWLDAGVFSSHIGFESAVSKDCWALTRNIASDNTPYYEAGAKLSYGSQNDKWNLSLLYLNGWQRMTRLEGSSRPAGGLQIVYKPTDKITLNYSNFLGAEGADSVKVQRFYNNFYGVFQLTDRFGLTVGFDYGIQQEQKDSDNYTNIYAPVAIARYRLSNIWALAARAEYYHDKNGMMILTGTPDGFKTSVYSVNIDYNPIENAALRLEGKVYDSANKIFERSGRSVSSNAVITASLAVAF